MKNMSKYRGTDASLRPYYVKQGDGYSIEWEYDRSERVWTVWAKDAQGIELDSEYVPRREDLDAEIERMEEYARQCAAADDGAEEVEEGAKIIVERASEMEGTAMAGKATKTMSGKTYNGVEYTRTIEEWGIEIGGKMRMRRTMTTDYTKNGVTARVIDHGTRGSCYGDRQNAEMYQVAPTIGRVRTYSNVDNAHAKAIELVLGR